MTTIAKGRGKLLASIMVVIAIALIIISLIRGHPIEKSELGDLYGCYAIDDQIVFRLTTEALVTPSGAIAFTARMGKYHAYLDLASPMQVTHRGPDLAFLPAPEPTGSIEVTRRTPRSLLLHSDVGPPIKAILSACRP